MNQKIKILKDVPLAPLTTLKIGGAARFFVRAQTETEVAEAFRFAEENGLELFILGGGSNVLISDDGFKGLVLQIALPGISQLSVKDRTIQMEVGAGVDWDDFVQYCVRENLQGVECLSGIPGFVGGTPVQNVGAYGQEVSESILSVRCFDRRSEKIVELPNEACGFAYRTSIFNTVEKERYIVLTVTYRLNIGGRPKIVYADLNRYFADRQPTLAETRAAVLEIRAAKSMVIDEHDPNSRSAGSFFKNPIVSLDKFSQIGENAQKMKIIADGEDPPFYRVDENSVKIPAAWLIEKAGFYKGYKSGNAGLSGKHTLAIINCGNATAGEVLALKNEIQAKVFDKFGVLLNPEPNFIGF